MLITDPNNGISRRPRVDKALLNLGINCLSRNRKYIAQQVNYLVSWWPGAESTRPRMPYPSKMLKQKL